jgi:hypothetical protein
MDELVGSEDCDSRELQFSTPEITSVVRDDAIGGAGDRKFDEVVVSLICQVRPPEVEHFYPLTDGQESLQQLMLLLRTQWALLHEISPLQDILILGEQGDSDHWLKSLREAKSQNLTIAPASFAQESANKNVRIDDYPGE